MMILTPDTEMMKLFTVFSNVEPRMMPSMRIAYGFSSDLVIPMLYVGKV